MNTTKTDAAPQPNKGVMDISAYVPGREHVHGVAKVYKLSSNETPLGCSPKAREAMEKTLARLEMYPDGQSEELRNAIADVHGLNAANIVIGNGSDELLGLLAHTYLGEGDEAIYTEHGFLVYRIQILANGATPVVAAEKDRKADVDAILACVTDRTKMVFLANPNNPTGTYVPVDEVRRLRTGLPGHVLLVLDAAYAEYVRKNDYEAGIELVSQNQNTVMTRTFSKIYGLAGLRIGWMYAPAAICDAINRVRGPFNVNALAIKAGAAAVRDRAFIEEAVRFNETWAARLTEGLTALGLAVTPSVGNFLLIHFPDDGVQTAEAADAFLCARGYVLRRVTGYGFPNALRLSVGSAEANEGVLAALAEFLKG